MIDITGATILVVDDDDQVRGLVTALLQRDQYDVDSASDAAVALDMISSRQYDCILTDVMMPGEDGISLLGRIHQSDPDLPVVIMTGYAQLEMAVNALKRGAIDLLQKPIEIEGLRQALAKGVTLSRLKRLQKRYHEELERSVREKSERLREMAKELDRARALLLDAATEKSRFMARVTHEMRTPMNGVIGALDLLAESPLSAEQAGYLSIARSSAETMLSLIDELLSFESTSLDRTVEARLVDPRIFFSRIGSRFHGRFASRGIDLQIRLSPLLPETIWTDPSRLGRIVEIFCENSLKFTQRGGVTVEVESRGEDRELSLRVTVVDTGCGVPLGMEEAIFEPFVQGEDLLNRTQGGAGLGLAIARQNGILLGGRVWMEHEEGGGSRFICEIPILSRV
ncbi:MAG: hypothetical protein Fur0034_16070 [Desulfuromonadia bacterium]